MSLRRYILLAGLVAGLVLVLLTASANVERRGSGAPTKRQASRIVPREIDPNLPIIPIFPPL